MRKANREIKDIDKLISILKQAEVCRIALCDDGMPYIIPLNFGIEESDPMILYFHCANEGKKLEIIRKNSKACFEVEVDTKVITGKRACDWSMQYRSVIGNGRIEIISSPEEKVQGLTILMNHYAGEVNHEFNPKSLELTTVLKLVVEHITGKEHILSL